MFNLINMNAIRLLIIEWNAWNGYQLTILEFEKEETRSLFSLQFSNNFLYIDLLFFKFKIFDKTDKN